MYIIYKKKKKYKISLKPDSNLSTIGWTVFFKGS